MKTKTFIWIIGAMFTFGYMAHKPYSDDTYEANIELAARVVGSAFLWPVYTGLKASDVVVGQTAKGVDQ